MACLFLNQVQSSLHDPGAQVCFAVLYNPKQVSNVAGYLFVAVDLYIKAIHRLICLITALSNDQQTAKRHSVLSPHGVGESLLCARGASCCGCIYI